MYTVTITKKEILEQLEHILLTVQFVSDQAIVPVVDPNKEVKLDKQGKPKKKKDKKPRFPTKTVYFKFKIDTTWEAMQAEIKKRKDAMEAAESIEIPINTPLQFT
jgi:hypothetical protein